MVVYNIYATIVTCNINIIYVLVINDYSWLCIRFYLEPESMTIACNGGSGYYFSVQMDCCRQALPEPTLTKMYLALWRL